MHLRDLGLLGSVGEMSYELSKIPEREFTYFDESYRLKFGEGYQKPYIEPPFCTFTYPSGAGLQLMRIAGGGKIADMPRQSWSSSRSNSQHTIWSLSVLPNASRNFGICVGRF